MWGTFMETMGHISTPAKGPEMDKSASARRFLEFTPTALFVLNQSS